MCIFQTTTTVSFRQTNNLLLLLILQIRTGFLTSRLIHAMMNNGLCSGNSRIIPLRNHIPQLQFIGESVIMTVSWLWIWISPLFPGCFLLLKIIQMNPFLLPIPGACFFFQILMPHPFHLKRIREFTSNYPSLSPTKVTIFLRSNTTSIPTCWQNLYTRHISCTFYHSFLPKTSIIWCITFFTV